MNRAVHAAASGERRVRGVDDRIDAQRGDVCADELDLRHRPDDVERGTAAKGKERHYLPAMRAPPDEAVIPASGDLLVLGEHPFNAETPLASQVGIITPNARFYVRNHFEVPRLDTVTWHLAVGGLVDHPHHFTLEALRRLPSRSLVATLECAGNGRSMLVPPVEGEQWRLGAVSTAEWTGVPLVEVLDRVGVARAAREVVFRGADRGPVRGRHDEVRYERSLTLALARDPDVLLAYAMNGDSLPAEHGFPLRLVVPGWYGMASVKWLTEIEVIDTSFEAFYQTDRYVFAPESAERGARPRKEPVTRMRVRALITEPSPGDVVPRGELLVRGFAWSGRAPVARVEVNTGDGAWYEARLLDEPLSYAWRRWELATRIGGDAGEVVLRARATDASGDTQPDEPVRNRLGYGNNAVQSVRVVVR